MNIFENNGIATIPTILEKEEVWEVLNKTRTDITPREWGITPIQEALESLGFQYFQNPITRKEVTMTSFLEKDQEFFLVEDRKGDFSLFNSKGKEMDVIDLFGSIIKDREKRKMTIHVLGWGENPISCDWTEGLTLHIFSRGWRLENNWGEEVSEDYFLLDEEYNPDFQDSLIEGILRYLYKE